jgi:anthranilate synthase/aminodeoxychorismate synthase-like glutamine amidotransferase
LILIDNYDSFTYNIFQYFRKLNVDIEVYKNDEITTEELKSKDFDGIIISPGPGSFDDAGISNDIIKEFYKTKKILGICLGMQCIAHVFNADVKMAKEPFHGKNSDIYLCENSKLFKNIPQKFSATRYHSLIVDKKTVKSPLKITAKTSDGILMALEHEKYPVYGVQFHPEAILSEYGYKIFENFINI